MKILILLGLVALANCSQLETDFKQLTNRRGPRNLRQFLHNDMNHNWAVLVAGSNTWGNYRHQADVAHAYQILIGHGFQKEKIITMMYDDCAHNEENPFPNELYNNYSHIDVYHDVYINYKTTEVTPSNFMKMMVADEEFKQEGHKVLESTSQDHVFFYFADHGADGLIAFPNEMLYATDLHDTIDKMVSKKMFSQMVIYIEACESGSMFDYDLPENVYATTAANGQESSYASYCDDEVLDVCLGDYYSVNWMHDTDYHSLHHRTVADQYQAVKVATTASHVQQFGDKHVASEELDQFQGNLPAKQVGLANEIPKPLDIIDSRKAHLVPHLRTLRRSNDLTARAKANHAIALDKLFEDHVASLFDWIVESSLVSLATDQEKMQKQKKFVLNNRERSSDKSFGYCHKVVSQAFFDSCYKMQKFPMVAKHIYKLKNLCKLMPEMNKSTGEIVETINKACSF